MQGVAAVLLHMQPAQRRTFIRPLIALIERVVDGDTDSIAASSTPAKHLTGPELHGLALVGATGPLAAPDRGRSRSEPGSREMWP